MEGLERRQLLAQVSPYIVTSASDLSHGAGVTLRDAINSANSDPNTDTPDITFMIGSGPQTITLNSPLPPIKHSVTIDGTSQPGYTGTPLITLTPATISGGAAFPGDGLDIYAGSSTVKGLIIRGFNGNGVVLAANGTDQVLNSYIGTNDVGDAASSNTGDGVVVSGSNNNTISANVVSGNDGDGVLVANNNTTLFMDSGLQSANTLNETVSFGNTSFGYNLDPFMLLGQGYTLKAPTAVNGTLNLTFSASPVGPGNYIVTGTYTLATFNATLQGNGSSSTVTISSSTATIMGTVSGNQLDATFALQEGVTGVGPGSEFDYLGLLTGTVNLDSSLTGTYQRNSGVPSGRIDFLATGIAGVVNDAGADTITGNDIGTNSAGSAAVANGGNGVDILGIGGDTIGTFGGTNVISGNALNGIVLGGASTNSFVVDNKIGTDGAGTAAVPNGDGVLIENSASNNTVGGTGAGAGNVISGNSGDGIDVSSNGNFVQGNKIGTNAAGTAALGNGTTVGSGGAGVRLGGSSNMIANNVISGNVSEGIFINVGGNMVLDNFIGTNAAGTAALGNGLSGITLQQSAGNLIRGNTVSGNGVSPLGGNGIDLAGSGSQNNVIEANLIGTDSAGTLSLPNLSDGVFVTGPNNTIGGTGAGAGNVISGNHLQGLEINGVTAGGNQVLGNFIGTNAAGTTALGNGLSGISLEQTAGNVTRGNIVSGNGVTFGSGGIDLTGSGSQGNLIQANLVGTDASGTQALPNIGDGVGVSLAGPDNTIGGTGSGAGNVISGNTGDGIALNSGASDISIVGNLIGTNVTGKQALGNHIDGIFVSNSPSNTIGGTTAAARNVISGNQRFGIWIFGALSTGNLVQGNFIGTDVTGTANLANSHDGVLIQQGPVGNTIGGTTTAARNVISGNGGFGVSIGLAKSNVVQGNFIGTDVTGAKALGNSQGGAIIQDAASNTIGGATASARNIISGNTGNGITIDGSTATANLVQGNFIGTDVTGTLARGNSGNGVQISSGATNNTIGGTGPGEGNLISGNGSHGISISTGTDNLIEGNKIGVNAGGMGAIGNVLDGIQLSNSAGNTISGNLVSGNGINQDAAGINLESNDRNNIIAGNEIGTDVSGNKALGNSLHGIFLGNGSSNNTIGGPTYNDRNVISGNGQFPVANLATQGSVGVYIYGANTSGNVVQGNYIGTNAAGNDALTNSVIGVLISQSSGNTVQGNLISGNRLVGLEIAGGAGGTASGNLVQGNLIGTDAGGTRAVPNGLDGIFISDAPNNSIGGTTAGAGNLISGNGSVGIQLFGPLTRGNVVQGNALGLNSAGRPTLPNRMGGIFVNTGPLNNKIGGTAPGQANRGQSRPLYTVSGSQQSNPGSTAQTATAAGRRFRIRGRARTSLRAHSTAH